MAMMKTFTSTARKDGRWWVVQCDQEPGALSQVARLDQAREHQREAISFVTDIPESEIEVQVKPVLDDRIFDALTAVARKRSEASELGAEAAALAHKLAFSMQHDDGYSLRDIGFVLGVSHQRAKQIIDG